MNIRTTLLLVRFRCHIVVEIPTKGKKEVSGWSTAHRGYLDETAAGVAGTHPFPAPDTHVFDRDSEKAVTLSDFLFEVVDILLSHEML